MLMSTQSVCDRQSLEVITTSESEYWNQVLEEVGTYAFYNLASFHRLSELRGEGRAEMLVYRDSGYTIIYPMLIRDIVIPTVVSAEEGLKDATSVPGLAGPLASASVVPENTRLNFIRALQAYLAENRIVTAYSLSLIHI